MRKSFFYSFLKLCHSPTSLSFTKVVPRGTGDFEQAKELKEMYLRKAQRRHDWLIASFGILGGGVMGFLTSLIFWPISGKC